MRSLLLSIFFLATMTAAKSQTLPVDSSRNVVSFNKVVHVDSTTKDELYLRAREWMAKTYRSANDVIQMDDKNAGKIVGKALAEQYVTTLGITSKYKLYYTITIVVKDNRYRYEISDYEIQSYPNTYVPNPPRAAVESVLLSPQAYNKNKQMKGIYQQYRDNIFKHAESLALDLGKAMLSKNKVSDLDNW